MVYNVCAAIKNAPLCSFAGGIKAITRNVLDCEMPRLNEALTITLLYLLNYKKTRKYVRLNVGLEVRETYIYFILLFQI